MNRSMPGLPVQEMYYRPIYIFNLKRRLYHEDWDSQVELVVKNTPANAGDIRDTGLIPWSGRSPGGGHGSPLQYPCLENPMDRGAWQNTVHVVAKSDMTERLCMHTHHEGSNLSNERSGHVRAFGLFPGAVSWGWRGGGVRPRFLPRLLWSSPLSPSTSAAHHWSRGPPPTCPFASSLYNKTSLSPLPPLERALHGSLSKAKHFIIAGRAGPALKTPAWAERGSPRTAADW